MKTQVKSVEKDKEVLKRAGLKNTPARQAVLSTFGTGCLPLSAEQIYQSLKKKYDLATIYRILNKFERGELIRRINLKGGTGYYELVANHHHHLICQGCGLIEDFSRCGIENMQNAIIRSSKKFNEIKGHSLELHGLCKKCS